MKVKSAAQTANLGKDHRYLGHFKQDKVVNQGHNDGPNLYQREPRELLSSEPEQRLKVSPVLDIDKDFAVFGGELGTSFRIDKNTELGVSGGAVFGRGRGEYRGEKMPTDWRVGAQFKRRF